MKAYSCLLVCGWQWICGSSLVGAAAATQSSTILISGTPAHAPANSLSTYPSVSADGRFISYTSYAGNILPGVGEPTGLVYVYDTWTHTNSLASKKSDGTQADNGCYSASLNADGRFVVFDTASRLIPEDLNGFISDVYLRDLVTGYVELISISDNGVQGNSQSVGGRITPDGRFVAFSSLASTLVLGDTNGVGGNDVFVKDRRSKTLERVSINSSGVEGNLLSTEPAISADGRFVAFSSFASNLVPGDTNGQYDVFVRDRQLHVTTLVSVRPDGTMGDSDSGGISFGSGYSQAISANGRFVAFRTYAQNLAAGDQSWRDVLVKDLWTGALTAASVNDAGQLGNGSSDEPRISGDGRWVLFQSEATNFVPNDTLHSDVFLRDMVTGTTERVSLTNTNAQANNYSWEPAMSADARFIAFASPGTNFVPNHYWLYQDIYLRTRALDIPQVYCAAAINSLGCAPPIAFNGSPSASAGAGFAISASEAVDHKIGRLVYSTNGANETAFAGGLLCLHAPQRWTALQLSGGSVGPPSCSGTFQFDFNTWIAGGRDPALSVGQQVWTQWFIRDPASPTTLNSTNALTFVIAP